MSNKHEYDYEFKIKVAKEAISTNNNTFTSKKYGVNVNTVRKWRREYEEGKYGVVGEQSTLELNSEIDIAIFKKEVLNLKRQLEESQNDLKEAMTLIGEKDFYIKKLQGSLNK
ncbi:transposase [Solibacillus sp. FSL K6-1554]|uniref:transposase n=1 Tax=Solibacillus sp. FSL K6-1554 TaxID=2921472 RepID=UPI0030FC0670